MMFRHAVMRYGLFRMISKVIVRLEFSDVLECFRTTTKQYCSQESLSVASAPIGCTCSAGMSGLVVSLCFHESDSSSHRESTNLTSKLSGATSTEDAAVAGVGADDVTTSTSLPLELLVEAIVKDWRGMKDLKGGCCSKCVASPEPFVCLRALRRDRDSNTICATFAPSHFFTTTRHRRVNDSEPAALTQERRQLPWAEPL